MSLPSKKKWIVPAKRAKHQKAAVKKVRGFCDSAYVLRTNHSMVALSREGRSGLWLRTKARVAPSITSKPPAKMPNNFVTDH